ncbi:hypothetical protein B484DRAFT_231718 [Ochromonadaceae sp. CCMP2298]|nr:hypothetical protein B484DRAFT_231718 [Ochromonadaceae sp. CCMP2298]
MCIKPPPSIMCKVIAIVAALTLPMRKKVVWLQQKLVEVIEEAEKARRQVVEENSLLERYAADIATYRATIEDVRAEKHTMQYRRTRGLLLGRHDISVQELIVEAATEEYRGKLDAVLVREAYLKAALRRLTVELGGLSEAGQKLQAAHRAVKEEVMEVHLESDERERLAGPVERNNVLSSNTVSRHSSEHARNTSTRNTQHNNDYDSKGPRVANVNEYSTPTPDVLTEMVDIADTFVQTQRLSEVLTIAAFAEPVYEDMVAATRKLRNALDRESRRLKAQERIRILQQHVHNRADAQIDGHVSTLAQTAKAVIPQKLMGFANRIDTGLHATSSPTPTPTPAYLSALDLALSAQKHPSGEKGAQGAGAEEHVDMFGRRSSLAEHSRVRALHDERRAKKPKAPHCVTTVHTGGELAHPWGGRLRTRTGGGRGLGTGDG